MTNTERVDDDQRQLMEDRLRQTIEASEQERRRWARELHNETLQDLAALKVTPEMAQSGPPGHLQQSVDVVASQIGDAIDRLRELISELRPATLDEFGVASALSTLVERRRNVDRLEITLDVELAVGSARLLPEVEIAAYRIVQEALTNVSRHANAEHVTILIGELDGELSIAVTDDGKGFEPDGYEDGLGLLGMRERVDLLAGALAVESTPGRGTTVRATLPARLRPDRT